MDSIKDIIPSVIGEMSKFKPQEGMNIGQAWERISGGKGSRAVDLKDGTLFVHVDSSLRAVKLNLNKEILLGEMQRHFPKIKQIYLKVAKV